MDFATEQFVHNNDGTKICYQTLGAPTDPAILLLSGGAQSMLS